MDSSQLVKLFDLVAGNWNFPPMTSKQRARRLDIWNRYLGDVDYQTAVREIDKLALTGGYPPKPGVIRVAALAGDQLPPIPAVALIEAKALTTAIQNGTRIPTVHPLVAQTVEEAGLQRDDVFLKIYEQRRTDHLAATYSDGANMTTD